MLLSLPSMLRRRCSDVAFSVSFLFALVLIYLVISGMWRGAMVVIVVFTAISLLSSSDPYRGRTALLSLVFLLPIVRGLLFPSLRGYEACASWISAWATYLLFAYGYKESIRTTVYPCMLASFGVAGLGGYHFLTQLHGYQHIAVGPVFLSRERLELKLPFQGYGNPSATHIVLLGIAISLCYTRFSNWIIGRITIGLLIGSSFVVISLSLSRAAYIATSLLCCLNVLVVAANSARVERACAALLAMFSLFFLWLSILPQRVASSQSYASNRGHLAQLLEGQSVIKHFLLGVGTGAYPVVARGSPQVFNGFFQYFAEQGVLPIITIVLIVGWWIRRCNGFKNASQSMTFAPRTAKRRRLIVSTAVAIAAYSLFWSTFVIALPSMMAGSALLGVLDRND